MLKLKSLSIVVPCYNEEEVIYDSYNVLNNLICNNLKDLIHEYEIVLVNNGSNDATLDKMLSIQTKNNNIVIVDLRNNFGYQGSISAGLHHATKDMIVTIDADLQDDPEKISEMIKMHYDGYDLVLGIRENRDTDSFFKRHSAQIYYKFLNAIGVNSVYNHGEFRLMSKELLEEFKKYSERNRYIRSLILSLDNRYGCIYYKRTARTKGSSKFNISNLFSLAVDGITSFSTTPIRFIFLFGIILFLISILGMFYVLYEKFINNIDVPGWAFTSILIMIFGGLNSLFIGVIGEYIGKTYMETKHRPIFSVRKIYKNK